MVRAAVPVRPPGEGTKVPVSAVASDASTGASLAELQATTGIAELERLVGRELVELVDSIELRPALHLKEGDEIVLSAQFMLDSESRLREAIQKMLEVRKHEPGGH